MKKALTLALLLVFVAAAAFASGGGEKAAPGKVKLVWYIWDDPEKRGHNVIVQDFLDKNPNYEIEISRTPFSKYEETIRTILAGGDVPNVIQVNDDHVKYYASNKWLLELDAFAKDWTIKRDDTYTNFWDFNFFEGKMISVTPVVKVRFHLYNKDLFDKAGLNEPPAKWEDPNWTWEVALDAAKKIVKKEGDRTAVWGWSVTHGAAAAATWVDNNIVGTNTMYSSDGKKFVAATPDGYNAMQFLVDLSYKHFVQPPWGINQKGENLSGLWRSGKVGLIQSGSFEIPPSRDNEFEWNVTSTPMKKEGHSMASLVCYGVPAKTKNPKESGFFAAALMGEFAQKTWAQTGFGIPVVKEFVEKYYIQPDEKPSRQTMVIEGLNYAYPPTFTVHTSRAKALWDATYKLTFSGEKTAKENMLAIKDEIELFLAGKK